MEHRIAIIDPDPILSESISRRLAMLIPTSEICTYLPSQLANNEKICIHEDIIVYDETVTDFDVIEKHFKRDTPAKCVSLLKQKNPVIRRRTGSELAMEIRKAISSDAIQTNALEASKQVLAFRNCLCMIVSFTSLTERENYFVSSSIHFANTVDRKIRLDLMPGVCMPRNNKANQKEKLVSSTGISDLLLRLEMNKITHEDLLDYLRHESDGWFSFGPPDRSDDIICCKTDVLTDLLLLIRRLCDTSAERLYVAVVIEGFPFSSLKKLCVYPHELHFLFPSAIPEGDDVCERELNELMHFLPPGISKFITTSKRQPT